MCVIRSWINHVTTVLIDPSPHPLTLCCWCRCFPETRAMMNPFPGSTFSQLVCKNQLICGIFAGGAPIGVGDIGEGGLVCWRPMSETYLQLKAPGPFLGVELEESSPVLFTVCALHSNGHIICWLPYPPDTTSLTSEARLLFTVPFYDGIMQLGPIRQISPAPSTKAHNKNNDDNPTIWYLHSWALHSDGRINLIIITVDYNDPTATVFELQPIIGAEGVQVTSFSGFCALTTLGRVACLHEMVSLVYPLPSNVSYTYVDEGWNEVANFSMVCGITRAGTSRCAVWAGLAPPLPPLPQPSPEGYIRAAIGSPTEVCVLKNGNSTATSGLPVCFGLVVSLTVDFLFWRTPFVSVSASEAGACGITIDGDARCTHLDHGVVTALANGQRINQVSVVTNGAVCFVLNGGMINCTSDSPFKHVAPPPTSNDQRYSMISIESESLAGCGLFLNGSFEYVTPSSSQHIERYQIHFDDC
jgi:hypothetical protein